MTALRPRVIPCLLLDGGRLVKTVRFKDPTYVGDPMNAVRIFNEKAVDELMILDITATRAGRQPQLELLGRIASEAFMPVSYGGGVADVETCARVLAAGMEKVVFNTAVRRDPGLIASCAERFGSQAVVAAVDVIGDRRGRPTVYAHERRKAVRGSVPVDLCRAAVELGAGELLVTVVDREGTRTGLDVEVITALADAVDVPLIAHGGVGSVEDIAAGLVAGAEAVAAGTQFVMTGRHRAVLITYLSEGQRRDLLRQRGS